jgi:hypothetical protein
VFDGDKDPSQAAAPPNENERNTDAVRSSSDGREKKVDAPLRSEIPVRANVIIYPLVSSRLFVGHAGSPPAAFS